MGQKITEVTLLFPGQGSQYVKMGTHLLEKEESQHILKTADNILEYSLSSLMTQGPEEKLTLTQNTQPAILTHSIMIFTEVKKFLEKNNIKISKVLGHSVGEYGALVAAGAISFEQALLSVHHRGKFMQEAVNPGVGKMIAILKVPEKIIQTGCEFISNDMEQVMPANINGPSQIVVSGHANACDRLILWLQEHVEDPHRCVELNVSAPFHSSLMKSAEKKLAHYFSDVNFLSNRIPYIANVDATEYPLSTNPKVIMNNLIGQVSSSVLWNQSFSTLTEGTTCLEIGPGKTLMGLGRSINKKIKIIPTDVENLDLLLEEKLQ